MQTREANGVDWAGAKATKQAWGDLAECDNPTTILLTLHQHLHSAYEAGRLAALRKLEADIKSRELLLIPRRDARNLFTLVSACVVSLLALVYWLP